jgi:uroporphyrinogen-III decarboxylase
MHTLKKVKMVKGVKHSLKQRGFKYFGFEMPARDVRKIDREAVQHNMNRSEFIRFVLDKNGTDDIGIDWGVKLPTSKVKSQVKPFYGELSPVQYRKMRGKSEVLLEMPLTMFALIERASGKAEMSRASVVRNILKKELGR